LYHSLYLSSAFDAGRYKIVFLIAPPELRRDGTADRADIAFLIDGQAVPPFLFLVSPLFFPLYTTAPYPDITLLIRGVRGR